MKSYLETLLNTPKEKFDVIILSNLIGVLEDIEHVFNELHKVDGPFFHSESLFEDTPRVFVWIG